VGSGLICPGCRYDNHAPATVCFECGKALWTVTRGSIVAGRYEAGAVSHYALLEAQRKMHATLLERTQAVADRYADSAALLQALGGGWWKEQPPASAATP
jgi:hypothetical protein